MSTLTLDEVAEEARNRMNLPANDIPRLKTLVPDALIVLAKAVSVRGDRALLVNEIDKTPALGEIDLADPDFDAVLIHTYRIPGSIITQAETEKVFYPVQTIQQLRATMPVDPLCVWYLLRDRTLIFRHPTTGALNTYVEPVRLAGSFIATLAELPDVLNDELVTAITMVGSGKSDAVNVNLNQQ